MLLSTQLLRVKVSTNKFYHGKKGNWRYYKNRNNLLLRKYKDFMDFKPPW